MNEIQRKRLRKGIRKYWCKSAITGHIGESIAALQLRNMGYSTEKTTYHDLNRNIQLLRRKPIENLLEGYIHKSRLMRLMKDYKVGLPDFLCRKRGNPFFIEIKVNNARIKDHQKIVIKKLREEGYAVEVMRLQINYNASILDAPAKFLTNTTLLSFI